MIRVEGTLAPMDDECPVTGSDVLRLLEPCVGAERLDQFKADQEIDFGFSIDGVARIRGNLYLQRGTPAASFRLVPTTSPSRTVRNLFQVLSPSAGRSTGTVLLGMAKRWSYERDLRWSCVIWG